MHGVVTLSVVKLGFLKLLELALKSNRELTSPVGCPQGHDIFMATMLNGAAVMDGALLLIAGNETCPQPQVNTTFRSLSIAISRIIRGIFFFS